MMTGQSVGYVDNGMGQWSNELRKTRFFSRFGGLIFVVLFAQLCVSADAKKPDVKSEVAKTTISGYTQVQFQATNQDDAVPKTTFTIRRGRFQLRAKLTVTLSLVLGIGLTTDKVEARNLYLAYEISPKLLLKVGQLKKPFSLARLQSARKLLMIERPVHVRDDFDGYLGRDIGILAEWEPHKHVDVALGIFNGAGVGENAGIDNNNAKDVVGRLELKPAKRVTVGLNVSSRGLTQIASDRAPRQPLPVTGERVMAYGADISARRGGLRLAAEGLFGDKPEIGVDAQMLGLYLTAVYRRKIDTRRIVAIEHGGRIEFVDRDRTVANDSLISVTPYVGFYFHSNARLQINPIMRFPQQGDAVFEFITQAQIEF
ncbi:hypothetical protein IH992_20830 [Candidatus Poribacteria bacterium]|nr:hypothetical protein [Candidatus Poribacteria bacterium]